jgi:inorganic phosphate transporter, PiT family
MDLRLVIVVVLALVFDFLNGINDSSNIVATMISSRAIAPRAALLLTAVAEFSGPFIFGVAVATTIGDELVIPGVVTMEMILAALISAVAWNLLTRALGIPSSSSHAMVGGIIGAVASSAGWTAIKLAGIGKVLIVLFTSPLIGFAVGFLVTKIILLLSSNASPKINTFFKRFQLVTSIALALSHGTNDSQKTMGIITLALVTAGVLPSFHVPIYVIFACAFMIAAGTSIGSRKLIRTLGSKFYKIKPLDAFSAQLASAAVILGASLVGGPVSTTQVVSSSIMGVGASVRLNKVRWGVAGDIITAWFLTIPATGLVAAGLHWLIKFYLHL